MEEVNNQTPMENTPVENTQVITELQSPPLEKEKNILIPILLIVVFILLSIFAYLFFTDKIDIGIKNPFSKEEVVEEENEESTELINEEEIILDKEYKDDYREISFKYPSSWTVKDYEETFYEAIRVQESEDFFLEYISPSGHPGELCFYTDTPGVPDLNLGILYDNYVSIDSQDSIRRSYVPEFGSYTLCKMNEEGNYWNWFVVARGYVEYYVNMERADAEEIIEVMDRILLSFEYTGEEY